MSAASTTSTAPKRNSQDHECHFDKSETGCTNVKCEFTHPREMKCKFDNFGCKNPGCSFVHPSRGEVLRVPPTHKKVAASKPPPPTAGAAVAAITPTNKGDSKSNLPPAGGVITPTNKSDSKSNLPPAGGVITPTNKSGSKSNPPPPPPAYDASLQLCKGGEKRAPVSASSTPTTTTPSLTPRSVTPTKGADGAEAKSDKLCRFDQDCNKEGCPHVHLSRGEKQVNPKRASWNCPDCKIPNNGTRLICKKCKSPDPALGPADRLVAEEQQAKEISAMKAAAADSDVAAVKAELEAMKLRLAATERELAANMKPAAKSPAKHLQQGKANANDDDEHKMDGGKADTDCYYEED